MDNKELDLIKERYNQSINEKEENELDTLIEDSESEFNSNNTVDADTTNTVLNEEVDEEDYQEEDEESQEEEVEEPENIYLPFKGCLLCPAINKIGRVYQNKEGKIKTAELEDMECSKLNTDTCPASKIRLKLGNPEENAVDYVTAEIEKDINKMNKIAKKVETYDKDTQEYFFELVSLLREQE